MVHLNIVHIYGTYSALGAAPRLGKVASLTKFLLPASVLSI